MTTRIPARFRGFAFLLVLASLYFVGVGAQRAIESNSNRVRDWLPEHFEETKRLQEFIRHFGAEEFLMASWPKCGLDDERQARLAAELRKPAADGGVFFAKVMTGREVVEQLMGPPLELSAAQAVQRLRGLLLSRDGKTSSVVMSVADPDNVNRHQAVAFVHQCADRVPGLSASAIHLAGTTLDGVAIDEASQASLLPLSIASFAACLVLMYLVFRCLATTVMIFLVAFFNQQLTFAAVYYSGWHMDSVLLLAPSLIFVVTVSGGVHLTNYYRDAVRERGLEGAPLRALRLGWVPCLLSAATTSLGIISLVASHLVPIQKFGVYAAVMVLVGTGMLFLLLPSLFEQWPSRKWAARLSAATDEDSRADRIWTMLSGRVTRASVPILVLAVVGTIVGCWGVTKTRCTARIHDMFEPEARIVRDYNWLEENIGPLVPIEVIVKLPQPPGEAKSYETPMIDRLQLIKKVERAVRGVEGVEAVTSALTFSPVLPQSRISGVRAIQRARLKAMDRQIAEHLPDLAAVRYLSVVDGDGRIDKSAQSSPGGEHWWRVSARVAASQGQDYQRVLRDVERDVSATLAAEASQFPGASAMFSGGIPLVEKAQEQMLTDLINSFISAFLVIAASLALMMLGWSISELVAARSAAERLGILARCLTAALLAMLPNVFPCVAVFGAMGLMGIKVEVGTVMTATVAMGIAVDDTVHYVTWFRRGHSLGLSHGEAVRYAYRYCGTAMAQTSMIVGLGLLVYALSEFGPIQRFAWMMFSILVVALVSDLAVTPALLYSRWGRLFLPGPFCRQRPAEVRAVEPIKNPSDSDCRDIRVRPSATCAK
jgi:predicted RND superfamily exporter protein